MSHTPTIIAVLDQQRSRLRRARLRLRAAERCRRIGVAHSVERALVKLHDCGDAPEAIERNLAKNETADDLATRAFVRARQFISEHALILTGAA